MPSTSGLGTTKGVAVTGPSAISYLLVSNASLTAIWFQLFDQATAPVNGAVPKVSFLVSPGETQHLNQEAFALEAGTMGAGLAWGWSSTHATFTATALTTTTVYLVHT